MNKKKNIKKLRGEFSKFREDKIILGLLPKVNGLMSSGRRRRIFEWSKEKLSKGEFNILFVFHPVISGSCLFSSTFSLRLSKGIIPFWYFNLKVMNCGDFFSSMI
jgi:hypothetical protein